MGMAANTRYFKRQDNDGVPHRAVHGRGPREPMCHPLQLWTPPAKVTVPQEALAAPRQVCLSPCAGLSPDTFAALRPMSTGPMLPCKLLYKVPLLPGFLLGVANGRDTGIAKGRVRERLECPFPTASVL